MNNRYIFGGKRVDNGEWVKVSAARRAARRAAQVLEIKTAVQKSLAEINAEARKTGLTYGQYTALKEGGKI